MTSIARKTGCCLAVLLLSVVTALGQVRFATTRLQTMAGLLSIRQNQLTEGDNDGHYHLGHPLNVRVNQWGEVEHIGYKLFSAEVRKSNPLPVYDFLERYFLELDLLNDMDQSMRLAIDKVQLSNKNLDIIHTFDGSETLNVEMLNLKKYQVAWSRNGLNIMTATFDMDYQLLSGCNSIEAEQKLIRELQRYPFDGRQEREVDFPEANQSNAFWQVNGGTYILEEIRHTLYYHKNDNGRWNLVCDAKHPVWSTFNLMLSSDMDNDCCLDLIVDLYGYKEKRMTVPLRKWIDFCNDQGCKSYLGIKTSQEDKITGTMFMVNEKMGYNHMLTIELDKDVFAARKGNIRSRLYAYIPLHNVSDDYFKFYTKVPNVDNLK